MGQDGRQGEWVKQRGKGDPVNTWASGLVLSGVPFGSSAPSEAIRHSFLAEIPGLCSLCGEGLVRETGPAEHVGGLDCQNVVMQSRALYPGSAAGRYSAKKMRKPVNFFCHAPGASRVAVIGDFNGWDPQAHIMAIGPDGAWHLQIPLHHGHHQYLFLVDGKATLDPRAQGVTRHEQHEKVSLMSVS